MGRCCLVRDHIYPNTPFSEMWPFMCEWNSCEWKVSIRCECYFLAKPFKKGCAPPGSPSSSTIRHTWWWRPRASSKYSQIITWIRIVHLQGAPILDCYMNEKRTSIMFEVHIDVWVYLLKQFSWPNWRVYFYFVYLIAALSTSLGSNTKVQFSKNRSLESYDNSVPWCLRFLMVQIELR